MKKVTKKQSKENLIQLITSNEKFEAIKYIRNVMNLSLKDSKELADMFFSDLAKLEDYSFNVDTADIITPELRKNELNFVIKLLQNGEKIKAVKYVKDLLNCKLKDAKEKVESMEADVVVYGFYNENNTIIANESEEEPEPNAGTDSTDNLS